MPTWSAVVCIAAFGLVPSTAVAAGGSSAFIQRLAVVAVLVAVFSGVSFAQSANPLTANARIQLGALTGFVIRSAEKVPADLNSFRATPEVRSMGELFGHIADALFSMCSTAAGAKPPRTGIEKTVTDKPALIAALKEGVVYCNTVIDGTRVLYTDTESPTRLWVGALIAGLLTLALAATTGDRYRRRHLGR